MPDTVSGTPVLRWSRDSSSAGYAIEVFDSNGTIVRSENDLSAPQGAIQEATCGGSPLTAGRHDQFRVTSWRQPPAPGCSIFWTEDLPGVFIAQ
jgi:hypothetical protein